jgi:CRISPR-associated exonuclease Cas4
MTIQILLVLAILLITLGLIGYEKLRIKRNQLRMPSGLPMYQDTQEQPGKMLFSHRYRVKGKPDFLYEQSEFMIPIEVKTGRTPATPYEGHIMQLMTYCVLVEENYGSRPPHGIIRYAKQDFQIDFTSERERTFVNLLKQMRQKRNLPTVHRSHSNAKACAACGYRQVCDERLDIQLALPLDDIG